MSNQIQSFQNSSANDDATYMCALEHLSIQSRKRLLMVLALFCQQSESSFLNIDFDHSESYIRFHFDGDVRLSASDIQNALSNVYQDPEAFMSPFSVEHLLLSLAQLSDTVKVSHLSHTTTIRSEFLQQYSPGGRLCHVEKYNTLSHGSNIAVRLSDRHRHNMDPIVKDIREIFRGSSITLSINGMRLVSDHSLSESKQNSAFRYGHYCATRNSQQGPASYAFYLDGVPVRTNNGDCQDPLLIVHLDSALFNRDPIYPDQLCEEASSLPSIAATLDKIVHGILSGSDTNHHSIPSINRTTVYQEAIPSIHEAPLDPSEWIFPIAPLLASSTRRPNLSIHPGDRPIYPGEKVAILPGASSIYDPSLHLGWAYARASGVPLLVKPMPFGHWVYRDGLDLRGVEFHVEPQNPIVGATGLGQTAHLRFTVVFCDSVKLVPFSPQLGTVLVSDFPIYSSDHSTLYLTPENICWLSLALKHIEGVSPASSKRSCVGLQKDTLRIITAAMDHFGGPYTDRGTLTNV